MGGENRGAEKVEECGSIIIIIIIIIMIMKNIMMIMIRPDH